MYLLYNGTKYSCLCHPAETMVYQGLPEDFPVPVEGEITLCADDGFVLRKDNTADYLRQVFEDGILTLTNVPEPDPETEPETSTPTAQDDTDAMLVDHEYRITLLELGLSE